MKCYLIFHVELSPKVVASAFWRGEVENELRRIGMVDYKFNLDSDYEKCMADIDEMRREHTLLTVHFGALNL